MRNELLKRPDPLRAVLFDWDGTLVDSAEKSYRCYVQAFAEHGITYDHALFERTYSPDWYRTYQDVGLPPEAWAEVDARWLACYENEPSRLLPQARQSLERLAGRGIVLGLVSSGDPSRVRRELSAFELSGFFSAVVCGGETERRKPDPEPLLAALALLRVAAAEAAYLGDSPEDVQMAHAAGSFAVGIPGGFPNRRALACAAPELLAPSLEAAVSELLG